MVQISKADKRTVYRYLISEGVIVIHKDFSATPHKGTQVPNIQVWMLLRSLKDRGFVNLIFSWQYFYYLLNNEGKKHLAEELGLTEEVVPLTWKKDQKRQYEHYDDAGKGKRVRRQDRPDRKQGERGGRGAAGGRGGRGGRGDRAPRNDKPQQGDAPKVTETN